MAASNDHDIAIIGAGPVGMILASLLVADGVDVLLIERERELGRNPRARHLDGEAIRVLQACGVAERATASMHRFRGLRLVDAHRRALMEHRVDMERPGPQGWIDDFQMFQPLLLATLRERLEASGSATIRLGEEAVAIRQDEAGVEIDTSAKDSGNTYSATYAVGCDGAGSWVRSTIGCTFRALGPSHPFLVIDATPLDEDFELPEPVYSLLVGDPSRPHYVSPGEGAVPMRFEFMVLPDAQRRARARPAGIARLPADSVGDARVRFDRAAIYEFHSLLVDDWRVGRVFLAGDAAHVQPPFMGQGLCSGIRDAANLAWKLAFVHHGFAPDALLDTYGSERPPHVRDWIDEANRIGAIVMTTDAEAAAERDARMAAGDTRELRPLQPVLGPGLHGDAPAPAGTLAPQPSLPDGRRIDDVVGQRFLIVADQRIAARVPSDLWERVGSHPRVFVLDPDSAAGREMLEHHATEAIVVRPDRYLLGVASDGDELERLLESTLAVFDTTIGAAR